MHARRPLTRCPVWRRSQTRPKRRPGARRCRCQWPPPLPSPPPWPLRRLCQWALRWQAGRPLPHPRRGRCARPCHCSWAEPARRSRSRGGAGVVRCADRWSHRGLPVPVVSRPSGSPGVGAPAAAAETRQRLHPRRRSAACATAAAAAAAGAAASTACCSVRARPLRVTAACWDPSEASGAETWAWRDRRRCRTWRVQEPSAVLGWSARPC
mmetsp:Transcript_15866/g.42691  ORF Transcript_15866/g.42691 Transcript_15866/m.42691 type:complete len:211 (+) Transcript_15866:1250-1882(+)